MRVWYAASNLSIHQFFWRKKKEIKYGIIFSFLLWKERESNVVWARLGECRCKIGKQFAWRRSRFPIPAALLVSNFQFRYFLGYDQYSDWVTEMWPVGAYRYSAFSLKNLYLLCFLVLHLLFQGRWTRDGLTGPFLFHHWAWTSSTLEDRSGF